MEHGIDLYMTPGSSPCRLVLLVAAALNLNLNIKLVNLEAREQYKDEFLALNPQHTVPTIVDDGFALWESRAISRYLINKYGKGSSLYPEDLKTRALIDQRLDFDIGTLYARFGRYFYPQIFGGKAEMEHLKNLQDSLQLLDVLLTNNKFAVGNDMTLADLSLFTTVSAIEAAGIDISPYNRIQRWYSLVKLSTSDYQKINEEGIEQFKAFIKKHKTRNEL